MVKVFLNAASQQSYKMLNFETLQNNCFDINLLLDDE